VKRKISNQFVATLFTIASLVGTEFCNCLSFAENIIKQEAQLSLTNREMRLEVSQGHQTWYHSICYVWFPNI